MDSSLAKANSRSKHWEMEAKVGREKIAQMVKERDEGKQEVKVACLAASAAGEARAKADEDMARV